MSDDLFQAPGSNGSKPTPDEQARSFPTTPVEQEAIPDDFLKQIETGGLAVAYLREKARAHICFRCKNLFLVEEVIQTAGDVGKVMRERQGTCLIVGNDVTNETRLSCSHFKRKWGLLGYFTDALRAVQG